MKPLLPAAFALVVLLAGCTPSPAATTRAPTPSGPAAPSASVTPPTSPTALAWRDIPLAPRKASVFDVLLSDPRLLVVEPDDPWGPETFAVLGEQVVLEDPADGDMLTYSDGRRTGRGELDTDGWVVVDDLLARDSRLYVLQGDGDTATNRKVHVYSLGTSGALTPDRVLPGEYIRGNGPASLYFAGPNVVGWSFDDPDVLLDGPGPLPDLTVQLEKKICTVELPGVLKLRLHTRHAASGCDVVELDDQYAYLLVEDYTVGVGTEGYSAYVHRIALTSAGTDASYTLADSRPYTPARQIQVSDGHVYQLRSTRKSVEVLGLHPNS